MFATLIALFTLWALVIFLERRRRVWVFGAVVVGTVILLTHPITAIATSVGAAALIVSSLDRHDWCTFLWLAVAAVTVVLLALAWPYCSLVDLLSLSSIYTHPPRAAYRLGRLLADPEHRVRPGSYRPLPAWALYGGIAALLLVGIVGVSPGSSERFPVPCC
jgi:hypothetical protein